MSGYENGKIYKVIDENDDIIYVGSTKQTLKRRWGYHEFKCDEYKIVLIENYPCESKNELRKMEQKFIDLYNEMGLLNQRKAYRTKEEEKEYIKKYKKSDKYKEHQKEYQKRKEKCPFCDKMMGKAYIKHHIKNSCKNKENF